MTISAFAQHRDAVGELLRLVEIVRRQQHRLAEQAQRADHLPRSAARCRVEPGRRLVEEEEIRVADERDAEVEPALLAAGERLHARVLLRGETDELDHLVDVARLLVVAGEHAVRLAHAEVRPELGLLEHDADPLAELGARVLWVVPEHGHLAGVAPSVALEDLDRRRLAGAVRAEQAEDLALLDVEIDAAHRREIAVGLLQAANGDRLHSSSTSACAHGGNGGSSPPASAATALPQSGWWPTTTTVSPRPAAASRTSTGVAPGARRSSTSGCAEPERLRGLARAQQRARDDRVRREALVAQAGADRAGMLAARGGQRPKLVRIPRRRLRVTNDQQAHATPG